MMPLGEPVNPRGRYDRDRRSVRLSGTHREGGDLLPLGEIRSNGGVTPRIKISPQKLELPVRAAERCLAEQEMQRRLFGFDGLDDRLGGAHRARGSWAWRS